MPKPIVCLSEQLCQYLEAFRACFSKRQWKYFVTVLLGLVECEERKTMTGLLRVVGEQVSLSGFSRFLNKWHWFPSAVAATWQKRFCGRLESQVQGEHQRLQAEQPKRRGRPKQTVVIGYLIFDDSVHIKPKGRVMGGLGRHYSNTEQRVVNGHCLMSGLYVLLGQRCALQPQLYRQKAVCEQEGVVFRSKIDIAVAEIETFFEYAKDLLGSDEYQVMTAQAILRFWTLIACLMCFLEEQRALNPDQFLTCGDVRRDLQHQHRRNLLFWLQERFKEGCSVDQLCNQLALSNS